jgi:UDP-N-acetylmuramyl pentapeptide synthase
MHLHEVAHALNATAIGDDVAIGAIVTDTRKLSPGCLFVALKGPRYDGHDYAASALQHGAAAAEDADQPAAGQRLQRRKHFVQRIRGVRKVDDYCRCIR